MAEVAGLTEKVDKASTFDAYVATKYAIRLLSDSFFNVISGRSEEGSDLCQ